MDKKGRYPGYTALLPPAVRYDQELRPAAKLLYAEVSAMADVTGFCWATNRYLAALMNASKNTVSELLAQLEEHGYIMSEVLRDEKGAVVERRLYITDAGLMRLPPVSKSTHPPIPKNRDTPLPKNRDTPIPKNRDTPQYKNDNILEHPPYNPPKGGRRRSAEHKDAPDWKPAEFEKLWKWYPTGETPRPAPRGNRQRAIRAWDKLHPDEELIERIAEALARQAQGEAWQRGVGIPHLSTYLNGYGWEEADGDG
ncbi:MAG: helix-turn-helix domain-containing protein [Firmicutes bacterium]|nr:helix-turn-helix domain-containing protein [Bacillota bacterium]